MKTFLISLYALIKNISPTPRLFPMNHLGHVASLANKANPTSFANKDSLNKMLKIGKVSRMAIIGLLLLLTILSCSVLPEAPAEEPIVNQPMGRADTTSPVFSCPADFVTTSDIAITWPAVSAIDETDGLVSITITTSPQAGLNIGDLFPVGITTVTLSASDAAGNTTTCSFMITVNEAQIPDLIAPTLTCPDNFSFFTTPNGLSLPVTWPEITAHDETDGALTPTLQTEPTPGLQSGSTFTVGVTTVTASATDAAGNVGTCSFIVSITPEGIVDTDPPTLICPENITMPTVQFSDTAVAVNWSSVTAFDGIDGDIPPTLASSPTPGLQSDSLFPLGTTTLTASATDAAGNTGTCSFTVTISEGPAFPLLRPLDPPGPTNPFLLIVTGVLNTLADVVNNNKVYSINGQTGEYRKAHYRMEVNLIFQTGGNNFTPIGTTQFPFEGDFDGNNTTINGLIYTDTNLQDTISTIGLFGNISNASISNLILDRLNLSNPQSESQNMNERAVAGLAGYARSSHIKNVTASGFIVGEIYVGGLLGYSVDCIVEDSSADVNISNTATNASIVGGLVGYSQGGEIKSSHSSGWINITGSILGGLVGQSSGSQIIEQSFATGDVSGGTGSTRIGGLVGLHMVNSIIRHSYATGDISGQTAIGGLVGSNSNSFIGGAYATGQVSGNANVGGLLGQASHNSVIHAVYSTGPVVAADLSYVNLAGLIASIDSSSVVAAYTLSPVQLSSGEEAGSPLINTSVNSTITGAYWNTDIASRLSPYGVGFISLGLTSINTYTGIYAEWNVDTTGDGLTPDSPWDFSSGIFENFYPTLRNLPTSRDQQRANNFP